MVDDFWYLQHYASTGSQQSFAQIVAQYADMVYSTCLRRLRDPEAAQDAAQAVFVTLARKARTLKPGTIIGGWLYRTARYEAAQASRAISTRRRHEMAAAGQRPESSAAAESKRALQDQLALSEELDRALDHLRTPERQAVVLRYFAGKSFAEVAKELRVTEEAARKRVSRGLERLRNLLRPAAGDAVMASGVAGLASIEHLLGASVQPAPASLTSATLKAVAAMPVTAGVSAAFTKGALITMAITKGKAIVGGVLVLLLFCGGAVVTYRQLRPATTRTLVLPPSAPSAAAIPAVTLNWQPRFNEVYGLREGEVLRNVAPPFIPERQAFWNSEQRRYGGQGGVPLSDLSVLTVSWDGTTGRWACLSGGQSTVANVVQMCVGLKAWEMDTSTLGTLPMPGDWVFRKGATTQQKMDGLAQFLSARVGRTVRLVQRPMMHDTIIVSGDYHFSPLAGHGDDGVIEFVGEPIEIMGVPGGRQPASPKERSTLGAMLVMLESYMGTPVVDQTGTSGKTLWLREYPTHNPQRLLANVLKQTGLTVAHEQRQVTAWSLVDDAGHPTLLDPPGRRAANDRAGT